MTPTPRAAEDRALWEEFRHHSRTFSLAARFLPRPVRMPVATLYLFCRTVDTIADERVLEVGAAQALEDVRDLEAKLACTLAGRPPEGRLWRRLGEVHDAFALSPEPLYELTRGAAWDLEGRPIKGRRDLIDYSNLVGGSVGAMMLPFLAERRADWPSLEAPARALGIAMQITNILRDVGEDVRRLGRVYVPETGLAAWELTRADLEGGRPPRGYGALMEELMEAAEAHYAEGFEGIGRLRPQARMGIYAAARMYREILNEVRVRRYDNLTGRAYVRLPRKLRLVLQDDYERRKRLLLGGYEGMTV